MSNFLENVLKDPGVQAQIDDISGTLAEALEHRANRKLASVRRIAKIEPIPGAEFIVKATVDGWELVTAISNGFKEGDLAVYLEVDSWVPTEIAAFLSKGKEPREFEGVKGERLRTIKLRGQVSQGLLLPLDSFDGGQFAGGFHWLLPTEYVNFAISRGLEKFDTVLEEGDDLTEILGVKKWEKPLPASLAGNTRRFFPEFIPKTDEERIQNCFRTLQNKWLKDTWEKSLKLDGSSFTMYVKSKYEQVQSGDWIAFDFDYGVCSRNLELKTDEGENIGNAFVDKWREIHDKFEEYCLENSRSLAIQGELMGEGIQKNREGLVGHHLYVYNIWDIDKRTKLSSAEKLSICEELGLLVCPILGYIKFDENITIKELLAASEIASINNPIAEGIVYKSVENPNVSFKVINNKFLLITDLEED